MEKIKSLFKNKKIVLSLIGFLAVLLLAGGATYAYFTSSMTGSAGTATVQTATVGPLTFSATNITGTNVLPGWSQSGHVTVSMPTNDVPTEYVCMLNTTESGVTDVYLTVSDAGSIAHATTASNGQIVNNITEIARGTLQKGQSVTTNYTLKFKETGLNQNEQMGQSFRATITCTLNGTDKVFYSDGKSNFSAIATDTNGNKLTVSTTIPTPTEAATQRSQLASAGLGLTQEEIKNVKLLDISVAESFTQTTVTLNVSDIASTGETVAVYHYNAKTTPNKWEAIGTYTVSSSGTIDAVFTSLSPIALVKKNVTTITLEDKVLADNPTRLTRTDNDFANTLTTTNTGTLYTTNKTEDDSTVYYFAGDARNNWVVFGKNTQNSLPTTCEYNGVPVGDFNKINYTTLTADAPTSKATCETNLCNFMGEGYLSNVDKTTCYVALAQVLSQVLSQEITTDMIDGLYESQGLGVPYIENETAKWITNEGDICWRIIRTNTTVEGKGLRLLYSGVATKDANGKLICGDTNEGYIAQEVAFNDEYDNTKYVGYMYGTSGSLANNRTNTNDSTIKGYIDNWYSTKTNLDTLSSKINNKAIYCNDRELGSGTYAAYNRLYTNKAPTLKCGGKQDGTLYEDTQSVADKFSVDSSTGNGKLTYPVALMTADEIAFAGGKYGTSLSSPYAWYFKNKNNTGTASTDSITGLTIWWLLSPCDFDDGYANAFLVRGFIDPGRLHAFRVTYAFGARPAISLASDALWKSGTGEYNNPYTVK